MSEFEKRVRRLLGTIDQFFESKGFNAAELDKEKKWLEAYLNEKEQKDADKRQLNLFG